MAEYLLHFKKVVRTTVTVEADSLEDANAAADDMIAEEVDFLEYRANHGEWSCSDVEKLPE